jgi:hypothetical protein
MASPREAKRGGVWEGQKERLQADWARMSTMGKPGHRSLSVTDQDMNAEGPGPLSTWMYHGRKRGCCRTGRIRIGR